MSDDQTNDDARLAAIEAELAGLRRRLEALESSVARRVDEVSTDHRQFKRAVEMRTARSGELSTRIAQRIARIEAALELLARTEGRETDEADRTA